MNQTKQPEGISFPGGNPSNLDTGMSDQMREMEYKKEAYNFFVFMLTRIRHRVVYFILRAKVVLEF